MNYLHHKGSLENGKQKKILFRFCKRKKVGLRKDGRQVIRLILALELHSHAKVPQIPLSEVVQQVNMLPEVFMTPFLVLIVRIR